MRQPESHRFTPAMFHILVALADRPRHGLGIVAETEDRTGGEIKLGPGILYTSIKKLAESGLIEEPSTRPPPDRDDPRRRYYRITKQGRQAVRLEAAKMARWVGVARDKHILDDAGGAR